MPSAAIADFDYDEDNRRLVVTFRGRERRSYAYLDVPPDTYEELCMASSKGTYVNKWIKPFYDCEEL
jgi:hypothetical protein